VAYAVIESGLDVVVDKVLHADYEFIIRFGESIPDADFPPGVRSEAAEK
jgi:hypothetical protein